MEVIDKNAYYNTEEWKAKADECKRLAGSKCSKCGATKYLQAHHLHYDNLGNEEQEDLQCLCSDCHEDEHGFSRGYLRRKKIKGGFNMIYHKSYEEVTESTIKSATDMKLFNWITNRFTYDKVEAQVVFSVCNIEVSQSGFAKMIKKLIEQNYIMRVSKGMYRLNPFIYVPFRGDMEKLQKDWIRIRKLNDRIEEKNG